MKANIYYKDKLYMETTLEEVESRHSNIKVGDRLNIDDNEVIVDEMKYSESQVDIITKDFK